MMKKEKQFKAIKVSELSAVEMARLLTSTVTPRPIALVSSIDAEGRVNLSPFSFFNVFSMNPPILVFSPSRRVRDNTTKHTLDNVLEHSEVVIHLVTTDIVEQTSLASTEYASGVNEFIKAGFTAMPSLVVAPPRVAESPVAFECKVQKIVPLGKDGGAGNLVICEVLMMHVDTDIIKNGEIAPLDLNTVARLGQNLYSKFKDDTIFDIEKPLTTKGIGIDKLPKYIVMSSVLTGNDLAKLANVEQLPSLEFDGNLQELDGLKRLKRHQKAQKYLRKNEIALAWQILLYAEEI
ncbi:MAG: flavin reductase [Flavobacteriaceae bacterium]|nr:MAG: flavin reductase [Flavobacteriaceae bacterium]